MFVSKPVVYWSEQLCSPPAASRPSLPEGTCILKSIASVPFHFTSQAAGSEACGWKKRVNVSRRKEKNKTNTEGGRERGREEHGGKDELLGE